MMKQLIRNMFLSMGIRVTKVSSPNPLTPKIHRALRELRSSLKETTLKSLQEERPKEIELVAALDGTQPIEAFYIIDALTETQNIEGDICEFGIAQGFTSALIAHLIETNNKQLWLFDSFEGLPKPTKEDKLIDDIYSLGDMDKYAGTMKHSVQSVKGNLEQINFDKSRVKIIPGFIEDADPDQDFPSQISFAYLDFDFYAPILKGLQLIHPKLSKGAKVIVDDYGFFSSGVKQAVEEFCNEVPGEYELKLPINGIGKFCILSKL